MQDVTGKLSGHGAAGSEAVDGAAAGPQDQEEEGLRLLCHEATGRGTVPCSSRRSRRGRSPRRAAASEGSQVQGKPKSRSSKRNKAEANGNCTAKKASSKHDATIGYGYGSLQMTGRPRPDISEWPDRALVRCHRACARLSGSWLVQMLRHKCS